MKLDFQNSIVSQAIFWDKLFVFRFAGKIQKTFLLFFAFSFFYFLYLLLFAAKSETGVLSFMFGISIIFLDLGLIFGIIDSFFESKLKNPVLKIDIAKAIESPEQYNLADFFDFETAKAIFESIKFSEKRNLPEINSSVVFYYLLLLGQNFDFIFSRGLLDMEGIKKLLKEYLEKLPSDSTRIKQIEYGAGFQETILESLKIAQLKNHHKIKKGDMLCALAKKDEIFKKILIDFNLRAEDIENLVFWLESLEIKIKENKKWWEWKNLIKKASIARDWSAGYAITLDKFSVDITESMKRQGFPDVIGHQKEIETMERVLARQTNNNVLIVGESGSGRKSMIQALAIKSVLGESLPEVNFKRVVSLDIASLLARTINQEEAETILDRIFQEVAMSGNIILVIDDIHNFTGGLQRPGSIDISGIIGRYLSLPKFQIIGITTFEGLHKYIEQNASIIFTFEKIEASEVSERETLLLLENLTLSLEAKYKKFISYSALRELISYCAKYIQTIPFPEKAMNLLQEVIVLLNQNKEKILLPQHVAKIVSEKTQIPVGEIENKEREILLNLEDLIHKRIINQEEAVSEVSSALRRARARVTVRKGPMGAFLFLGPTGVGKTETSKALADIYFGSEEKTIRLDMSEFQDVRDIPRLIGSPGQESLLTTKVRENPFSLILLDEIEKAHPNILNLFLQVLDEGHLTDGTGRKIDFKNSIIIATSNAGYQIILEAIKNNKETPEIKTQLLEFLFKEGIFRPEFINRFDGVVIFRSLNKEHLLQIAELSLQKLKKNLIEKGIDFKITQSLKEKIVELSYNPVFGAREMRRVIQDKVENVLAQALLSGNIKRGTAVEIDSEKFELKII